MIRSHRPEMSTVGWPPCVAVNNDARRGVSGRATCGYMRHVEPQMQYFAVLPKHIPPQISGASLPSEYHMYSKSNPACRHAPRTSFEIVFHVATGKLSADTSWPVPPCYQGQKSSRDFPVMGFYNSRNSISRIIPFIGFFSSRLS